MKKTFIVLLVLTAMVLCLTGCRPTEPEPGPETPSIATITIDKTGLGTVNVRTQGAFTQSAYGQITGFETGDFATIKAKLTKVTQENYSNVRFTVEANDSEALQLIAMDTNNNYYNVVGFGWGPPAGFSLATAETTFYIVGLKAGTFTVTIKLIDLNDNNAVLAQVTETITVAA